MSTLDNFQVTEPSLNGSAIMDQNKILEYQLWDEATALNDLIAEMEERLKLCKRQFQGIMMYLGIEDFDAAMPPDQRDASEKELDFPADLPSGFATYIYQALQENGPLHVRDIIDHIRRREGIMPNESTVTSRLSTGSRWFRRVGKGVYDLA